MSLFSSQLINSTQINEASIQDSVHDTSGNESLNISDTQENKNNINYDRKQKNPIEYFDLKNLISLSDLCKKLQTMPIDLEPKSSDFDSNILTNNQFMVKSAIINTATPSNCFGEMNHRKTIPAKKTQAKFTLPTKLNSPNKRSIFLHNLHSPYKPYSNTNSYDDIYESKKLVESNESRELDVCCSGIRKKLKIQNSYATDSNPFSKFNKKPPSYEESLRKIVN